MKHFCYGLNDFSYSSEEIDSSEGVKDHKQTVKHSEISAKQHQQQKPKMGDRAVFSIAPSPIPSSIHYCKRSISSLPFPI